MKSPRSLLYRLEYPQTRDVRDLPDDPELLIEAIGQHLNIMLNTRQGMSQTVPDFGTIDFSDIVRGHESISKVQDDLRRSIEKYEPRLRDVQVHFTPVEGESFTLHFDIEATVVAGDDERLTVFRSSIENNGEVKVSRMG
jgi:type VI secretion system protein